jgi:hypothetical protein
MTAQGYAQLALYLVVLLALVKPLGWYMARVYEGRSVGIDRLLGPLERLFYRLLGTRPDKGMRWKEYAGALLLFNRCMRCNASRLSPRRYPRSTRRRSAPCRPTRRSIPLSALPPTPTGRAMAARLR